MDALGLRGELADRAGVDGVLTLPRALAAVPLAEEVCLPHAGDGCRGLAAGRPVVKLVQAEPRKAACLDAAGEVWQSRLTERVRDGLALSAYSQGFRQCLNAPSDTWASRRWKVIGSGID